MRIEINRTGVYDEKGNEIGVGTVIDVKGEAVPAWLVNKGRIVADKPTKASAITNKAD